MCSFPARSPLEVGLVKEKPSHFPKGPLKPSDREQRSGLTSQKEPSSQATGKRKAVSLPQRPPQAKRPVKEKWSHFPKGPLKPSDREKKSRLTSQATPLKKQPVKVSAPNLCLKNSIQTSSITPQTIFNKNRQSAYFIPKLLC